MGNENKLFMKFENGDKGVLEEWLDLKPANSCKGCVKAIDEIAAERSLQQEKEARQKEELKRMQKAGVLSTSDRFGRRMLGCYLHDGAWYDRDGQPMPSMD